MKHYRDAIERGHLERAEKLAKARRTLRNLPPQEKAVVRAVLVLVGDLLCHAEIEESACTTDDDGSDVYADDIAKTLKTLGRDVENLLDSTPPSCDELINLCAWNGASVSTIIRENWSEEKMLQFIAEKENEKRK
jgi:DNA-directed RNA polymerase specialized sigma24 family protein